MLKFVCFAAFIALAAASGAYVNTAASALSGATCCPTTRTPTDGTAACGNICYNTDADGKCFVGTDAAKTAQDVISSANSAQCPSTATRACGTNSLCTVNGQPGSMMIGTPCVTDSTSTCYTDGDIVGKTTSDVAGVLLCPTATPDRCGAACFKKGGSTAGNCMPPTGAAANANSVASLDHIVCAAGMARCGNACQAIATSDCYETSSATTKATATADMAAAGFAQCPTTHLRCGQPRSFDCVASAHGVDPRHLTPCFDPNTEKCGSPVDGSKLTGATASVAADAVQCGNDDTVCGQSCITAAQVTAGGTCHDTGSGKVWVPTNFIFCGYSIMSTATVGGVRSYCYNGATLVSASSTWGGATHTCKGKTDIRSDCRCKAITNPCASTGCPTGCAAGAASSATPFAALLAAGAAANALF